MLLFVGNWMQGKLPFWCQQETRVPFFIQGSLFRFRGRGAPEVRRATISNIFRESWMLSFQDFKTLFEYVCQKVKAVVPDCLIIESLQINWLQRPSPYLTRGPPLHTHSPTPDTLQSLTFSSLALNYPLSAISTATDYRPSREVCTAVPRCPFQARQVW